MSGALRDMLGVEMSAGPEAVLGLPGPARSADQVIAALRARLAAVAAHPDGASAKADEARVALHASAARLLAGFTGGSRLAAPDREAGAGAAVATPTGAIPFEGQVELAMAMYGGWNAESARWITMLAEHQGVSQQRLREVVAMLASPRRGAAAPAAATVRRPGATAPREARPGDRAVFAGLDDEGLPARDTDPGARALRISLLVLGGIALVIAGLSGLLILASGGGGTGNPPAPVATMGEEPAPEPVRPPVELFPTEKPRPQPAARAPRGDDRPQEWADLARRLNQCIEGADVDAAAAVQQFREVTAAMSREWPRAAPDAVTASTGAVVDFLYRLARAGPDMRGALDAVIGPASAAVAGGTVRAEDVAPAVWGAGVLARLSRERELPASVTRRIGDTAAEVFGTAVPQDATFRSGAAVALARLAGALTPEATVDQERAAGLSRAWTAWIGCAEAVEAKGGMLHDRAVLLAMEHLMSAGPEPSHNQAVFDALQQLTLALPWRAGDESRRWLLRWLDAPRFSSADLHVVTSALASKSGAEGVDISFALSPTAGWSQRAELRDRLATVWSLGGEMSRGELVSLWGESARQRLLEGALSEQPLPRLARAARLARVNAAAARVWAGEAVGSKELSGELDAAIIQRVQATLGDVARSTMIQTDRTWAEKYLSAAQNPGVKRDLLGQLPPTILIAADAEVLAEDAVRGNPPQVRAEAQAVLLRHSDDPLVVNAMLEQAPMLPATLEMTQLLERFTGSTLPGPRDPAWKPAVRRALVERSLLVLADSGDAGVTDDLSELIGEAYEWAARGGPAPGSQAGAGPAPTPAAPDAAAQALRVRWQQEAAGIIPTGREPVSSEQLSVRRSTRLAMASGPIQRFHAEQVCIAELMAFVISAERPARADEAGAILADLASVRRRVNHVSEQVEAAEGAIMRLWLLRFGEAAP